MRRIVARYAHRRSPNELTLAFIALVLAGMNIGLGWSALRVLRHSEADRRTPTPTFAYRASPARFSATSRPACSAW